MGFIKWLKHEWEMAGIHPDFWNDAPPAQAARPLEERIATAGEYRWTKEELNAWLDTLPEEHREQALRSCKKIAAAGQDWMEFLCRIRADTELREKEKAAEKKANRMTVFDVFWTIDNAIFKEDQRQVFAEARRRINKGQNIF